MHFRCVKFVFLELEKFLSWIFFLRFIESSQLYRLGHASKVPQKKKLHVLVNFFASPTTSKNNV